MIDKVYKTVLTILNKDNQGYVSPSEFNLIVNNVQEEIFRGYFEDYNRYRDNALRGLTAKDGSELPLSKRQKLAKFNKSEVVLGVDGLFKLPEDTYYIETDGVYVETASDQDNQGVVLEEVERRDYNYLIRSSSKPSEIFPVYTRLEGDIKVSPLSIVEIGIDYLKKPSTPNWTYFSLPSGDPVFNPSNESFQDLELHESEFSKVVLNVLTYFGINMREQEIIAVSETLKDKMNIKNNL